MSNVVNIFRSGLCTGCGTCVGVCPQSALRMCINEKIGVYQPKLAQEKCNSCGICYRVCPGYSSNVAKLNAVLFEKKSQDSSIGYYEKCHIGKSRDPQIMRDSSSGGLVTSLLIHALEEEIIDGALITKFNSKKPLEPEPFIARSKEEIISASYSKYCPVPLSSGLSQINKQDGKFAVVGLPCHIHGIRKAESINNNLKKKIVLHFGLFCSHAPSFLATNQLLWTIGIRKESILKIDYRGNGWPGGMTIMLKNGKKIFVPHNSPSYWGNIFGNYFYPFRCTLCDDSTAEFSDLSFGDPWHISPKNSKLSLLIVRNKIGDDLVRSATSMKKIELSLSNPKKIIQSQKGALSFKKDLIRERLFLAKLVGKKVPLYSSSSSTRRINIQNLVSSFTFYTRISLTSRENMFYNSLIRGYLTSRTRTSCKSFEDLK